MSAEHAVPCQWLGIDQDSESWELRTLGAPRTMRALKAYFGDTVREVSAKTGIDERILLVQAACEAAPSSTHPSGKSLKSPRTEPGYPGRTGESDPGDFDRDAADWDAARGVHSSHGLTQCLIKTAVGVRPDLFSGVAPRFYRTVLWRPENAFHCLAAMVRQTRPDWREDPLALRFVFGAGGVRASSSNVFGAVAYSVGSILHWLAFWGDLASIA